MKQICASKSLFQDKHNKYIALKSDYSNPQKYIKIITHCIQTETKPQRVSTNLRFSDLRFWVPNRL